MKYTVHIYATVRVPIEIEADSQLEGLPKAEAEVFADGPFGPTNRIKAKREYADEITGFHVDEQNDPTGFCRSKSYGREYEELGQANHLPHTFANEAERHD